MKRISTLLCLIVAIGNLSKAQTVRFHDLLDSTYDPRGHYSLIGKISGNNLLIFSHPDKGAKLAIFDNNGVLLRERTYDFLNPNSPTLVIKQNETDRWTVINQDVEDKMYYTKTVTLDGNGEIVEGLQKIDSAPYLNLGWNAFYQLATERTSKYFLLYRLLRQADRILVNYLLLDKHATPIGSQSFYVDWDKDFETTSKIFLAPNGEVYFAIHDKAENYRLGSKLRLFKSNVNSNQPKEIEVYLKENKPIELMFDADDECKFLAIGGLYSNFYTKTLDGLLTVFFNPATNRADTIVYVPIDKEFKKEIKKGISSITADNLVNMARLSYFHVNADKSVSIVADLLARRLNASGTATSSSFITQSPIAGTPTPSSTPSQSFDQIRYDLSQTQLPAAPDGRRSSSRSVNNQPGMPTGNNNNVFFQPRAQDMGDWNRNISRLNSGGSNNSNWQNEYNSLFHQWISTAIKDNRMVQKSIVFALGIDHNLQWRTIVRNLYIPETPFTNLTTIPFNNSVSLINYESTEKSEIYLEQKSFSPNGKLITQVVCKPQPQLLFYTGAILRLGEKEILTLYYDPIMYRIGLASINW